MHMTGSQYIDLQEKYYLVFFIDYVTVRENPGDQLNQGKPVVKPSRFMMNQDYTVIEPRPSFLKICLMRSESSVY